MKIKKICSILLSACIAWGVLSAVGIADIPVKSAELDCTKVVLKVPELQRGMEDSEDYSIILNEAVEKQGLKFAIKSVTATKNKLQINAVIESSSPFDENSFDNSIVQMTIKNCEYESNGFYTEIIKNNTMEYKFYFYSQNGFDENIDIRFDAALPVMDVNAWVMTKVNISEGFDKVVEQDVDFSFANGKVYKFESDVMETSLYYKEDADVDYSYDNSLVYYQSSLLLKYNDKFYILRDGYSYLNEDEDAYIGQYSTSNLKYGDLVNDSEISIIPIKCNIKRSELEGIYNNYDYDREHTIEKDEENKITYSKEFNFSDNSQGIISKIEREKDKIKVYCTSDSEKKSMLMALGLMGCYDYNNVEYFEGIGDASDVKKCIYKDSEDENGYVIEFYDASDNIPFLIESNDIFLGSADKFEIENEIKVNINIQ